MNGGSPAKTTTPPTASSKSAASPTSRKSTSSRERLLPIKGILANGLLGLVRQLHGAGGEDFLEG